MARNRSTTFEPTNLNKLIDETMILLEREMNKYRISVEMNLQEVPEVPAIGNQLQQVLLNLLINARQAMNEGGRLIIGLNSSDADQTVSLSVRDFGTGIEEDKLRKIFQPYYSTKDGPDESGKGGTGLGLATCRNIIEAHGGKIRVESTIGKGTCFTLVLPIQRKAKKPFIANHGVAGAVSALNSNLATRTQVSN
jgi:signal transduction histidine kinase